jgi:hypothetical protein
MRPCHGSPALPLEGLESRVLMSAFGGTPVVLPGVVQAENYDTGGEGVAYHDTSAINDGGVYRTSEGVDIGTTAINDDGTYALGWTRRTEWLKYSVDVSQAGAYTLGARVSSTGGINQFRVAVDGVDVSGVMEVPNTGALDSWTTVSKPGVQLSAGPHTLRLDIGKGSFNVNYLSFAAQDTAPAAPSNRTAAAASASQINLGWADNSGNETGFNVDRSTDGTTWTPIATTGANVTSYAATGLAAATTYQFRVRATNSTGPSPYTATASATTQAPAAPAAPSNLTAAAPTTSRVDLTWSDNSTDESGFKVERSTDGTNFTQIATVGANAMGYAATGLSPSTAYSFRVRATGAGGDSPYSNVATATTPAPQPTPLISEDFASGSANFTATGGTWAATGGAYQLSAPDTTTAAPLNNRSVHATAVSGDFTLDADASVANTSSAWNDFAVVFGYQDPGNYYFFSSNESNDGATSGIFRVANGVSTELADVPGTITAGTTYHVRVERSGGQINAYRDGALVASAADSAFLSGRVGFGTKGDAASFDNLVVVGSAAPAPVAPAAPSNLAAAAASSAQVNVTWADNSTNETGFKVERSTDGVNFTQVAAVGANVTTYAAAGLSPSTAYTFRVRAYNAGGDSAYSNVASVTTPAATAATLVTPPQAAVDAAISAPLIRFNNSISGGAYTNGAGFGGASDTLALASYAGNTSADARLLQQMRYTITGGNEPAANGGYPAQHERHVTGMFALAKLTPRIWNQLTAAEKHKVDLIMEGTLVASAFTTGDANPSFTSGQSERTLDGDTNLGRDWNPNYREGMVGAMLVSAAYFGPAQAAAMLANYDHAAFLADVQASGLTNLYQTFNWKAANPTSIAPSGSTIQSAVRQPYRYHGVALTDVMGLYNSLLVDTYGKTVNAGLNGGAGINGAGKIASGADTLPNKGVVGMLKEFDSSDAGGPRSAANYAYDGFRPHQTNLLVMIASGLFDASSPVAKEAAARLEVGNTDLWYKLDKGYIGYYKGAAQGTFSTANDGSTFGFAYTRPVWENVLRPYLQAAVR